MSGHEAVLVTAMAASLLVFIAAVVLSALAGQGRAPFLESTGNVSDAFATQITPSGWTFIIWSVIYVSLALLMVYVLASLCRRNEFGLMSCSPARLTLGFYLTWCLNFTFNIGWLFLWDRRLVSVALAFLLVVVFSSYLLVFFSCYTLHTYGAWLQKHNAMDLWLLRVLAQNGICIYATWSTIATLLNLAVVLNVSAKLSLTHAATVSLAILAVLLCVWFAAEMLLLDRHVRYILSIHPVVIWALTGSITNNYTAAPTPNGIFVAVLLALACVMFVARVAVTIWRHINRPLYRMEAGELAFPVDIARRQRNILFK
ncbi:uncharacterized protein LOC133569816 [Nerophis ophidion]|uniref:uncharacterized protein LOC133569816 n=1 Tax=Nerophis ophidion TaxID=159077 RepID=UPI002AE0A5ED|nr:uncharacterized protein LOC133569816 [Nerophis ophidion]